MSNLMDYLEWRGDLTFDNSPVNEVDNLIFCLLAYVDFDGIVPGDAPKGKISLRQAAMEYFFMHKEHKERALGFIIPDDILTMFRRMASTRRYSSIELSRYINEVNEDREMQFSAISIFLPNEEIFVAFRGTDDTIVGWHEDFNLSHLEEVPAQRKATEYLNALDITADTCLFVGGHSKGGNLAVWGAIHATDEIRRHIVQIYSNDGPGFADGTVQSDLYRSMADRIQILLPDDSLIGLLLEHDQDYTVVKSNRKGIFQHDGLSWEVLGGQFLRADALSAKGLRNDTVVRERIQSMTREERERLLNIVFELLESTGAKTLSELYANRRRAIVTIFRNFRELPQTTQKTATFLLEKLIGNGIMSEKHIVGEKTMKKCKKAKHTKGTIHVSFARCHSLKRYKL